MGKISSIFWGILGIIMFIVGIYNLSENSNFWISSLACIIGSVLVIYAIILFPEDKPEDNFENER
jgi:hypothetical protein